MDKMVEFNEALDDYETALAQRGMESEVPEMVCELLCKLAREKVQRLYAAAANVDYHTHVDGT